MQPALYVCPSVCCATPGPAIPDQRDFPERVHLAFKRRLREVSLRTKAWIITGGTKAGVMKMVGDMVRETEDDVRRATSTHFTATAACSLCSPASQPSSPLRASELAR